MTRRISGTERLLEGLKSQELNRSVLPGVDSLGVDLPGVEIRS